jgi:hypothetical protein
MLLTSCLRTAGIITRRCEDVKKIHHEKISDSWPSAAAGVPHPRAEPALVQKGAGVHVLIFRSRRDPSPPRRWGSMS